MAYYLNLEGTALDAHKRMIDELTKKAVEQLRLPPDQLTVRMLRPQDLGLPNGASTFNVATANADNAIVSAQVIADNRFVGINGVLIGESGTSVVTQLRISRAGKDKRIWQIQDINFTESNIVWFDDPVIIEQNMPITINAYALATDAEWRATFLGAVVEKKGLLVD